MAGTLPTIPVNSLTSNGLSLVTAAQWNTFFTQVFQVLYGSDVVLTSNTPDGQLVGCIIQIILDLQDLSQQTLSSFDILQAFGTVLDQRLPLGGIKRLQGSFSLIPVTVNNTSSITIYGLDQPTQSTYTVSDTTGNQYELLTTPSNPIAANTNGIYTFQAINSGPVVSAPNTVINQVTAVTGVSSVNNATSNSFIGTSEETDAAAKIRFQRTQQNYFTAMYTALYNVAGVTSANIVENDTAATVNGIPPYSIWVVVGGNPAAVSIANAIYQTRSAGVGMYQSPQGGVSYPVLRPNGSTFTVYWSDVLTPLLYIQVYLQSINGVNPPQVLQVQTQLSVPSQTTVAGWSWSTTNLPGTMTLAGTSTVPAVGQLMTATGLANNTTVTSVSTSAGVTTVTFTPPPITSETTVSVVFTSPGLLVPGVGAPLNVNQVATLIQEIDPNSLVTFTSEGSVPTMLTNGGLSLQGTNGNATQSLTFLSSIGKVPVSGNFYLTYASAVPQTTSIIAWNASAGTIQTDLRALTGLGSITVAGTIATGLIVTMTGVSGPAALTITTSTLVDASANAVPGLVVPVTFANTLAPTSQQQPVLNSASQVIVYPMIIAPNAATTNSTYAVTAAAAASITVAPSSGSILTLTEVGGLAPFEYSLTTNASGGSCTSAGVYSSGASAGSDVVTVTDALGNTSIITIVVT